MAPATVTAVVVWDMVNWAEQTPGTNPPVYVHKRAYKRATVELPQGEFDRLSGMGAVAKPEQAAEAVAELAATRQPIPPGEEGDRELAGYSAADLIAYVTQFPGEKMRVLGIESQRSKPRATVVEAAKIDQIDAELAERQGLQPPGV